MKLSVRYKILLPLVVTVFVGFGSNALIGYQSMSGQNTVSDVVTRAFEAKQLANELSDRAKGAAQFVGRVLDMTNFVSKTEVQTGFDQANNALKESLAKLDGVSLSEKLSEKSHALTKTYAAWEADARLVLGLTASTEIPTSEKLTRSYKALLSDISAINSLVDGEAASAIADANGSLISQIHGELILSGLLAVIGLGILTFIARSISMPILKLAESMRALAGGDTAAAIPHTKRHDEIGQMGRTVEVFRENAISQRALEAQTETLRRDAEAQRIKDQQAAEERAAERLSIATSGLATGLKRLAAGDLAYQLREAFSPEFEALRQDFNTSVVQLAQTLTHVTDGVNTIDRGTTEISQGSAELANRTERQASSLEETAAAVGEITAKVQESTRIAEEARNLANRANSAALSSSKVVAEAVGAMGQIEESSSKINSIIAVIDQIAFQTNLLALNAGVEAARAGEAGKGFAVVAQEVRDLAQRSAQAAKEIKTLISRSSTDVGAGVSLVNQTGTALKDISDHIVNINKFMDQIALSAREQSANLAEVNTAMRNMDTVTQQNAAKVSETEAASRMLAEETQRLRAQIAQFDLGSETQAMSAPQAA